MSDVVNPIPAEEIPAWLTPLGVGLLHPPHGDEQFEGRVARRRAAWVPERSWGVRDAGRWVGTLATEERRLTVPAGSTGTHDVTVDALTAVSVAATHRRQGWLSRMLDRSLAAAVERGDPLSMLVAAEWPIYGRFGYAPATSLAEYRLRPRRPVPLLPPAPPGTTRMADVDEVARVAPELFERARRLRAGQVDRGGTWWARLLGTDGQKGFGDSQVWVVHDGPDGVDGLLGWKVTRDFDLTDNLGAIRVDDFVAVSDAAYRDLYSYLCGVDAVAEIELPDRPVDEPILWSLHDGRALQTRTVGDELWVRLLDVPAALAARGYAVPGSLVLDVVDTAPGGYGAGRVRLDAGPGGARCTPTADGPDLRLDQRAVAAAYLGGNRLRAVAAGLPVQELRPGALDLADAMFATPLAPWTQTGF